jgi:hypothetical protein
MNRQQYEELQNQADLAIERINNEVCRSWVVPGGVIYTCPRRVGRRYKLLVEANSPLVAQEAKEKALRLVDQWNRNELDELPETL